MPSRDDPPSGVPLAYGPGLPEDPAVEALIARTQAAGRPLDRAVAVADEMLVWPREQSFGSQHQALVRYFHNGASAARTVEAALGWRFGAGGDPRILDFAAGYGRVTRFLLLDHPAASVCVSDIDPVAVDHQRRRRGVDGFVSTPDPDALPCDRRFDAVVVLSLLSHLPEPTFRRWLARLVGSVAPGGLLLFSTLGEPALLPGRRMPPGGFHFEPMSETRRLDTASYGSAWVSEAFVARELAALAPAAAWRRVPQGLWHLQDVYLVVPDGSADPGGWQPPDEARGDVYSCEMTTAGDLAIGGWAAFRDAPAERVEVRLGERVVDSVEVAGATPDVGAQLGPGLARCGWFTTLPRAALAGPHQVLLLEAVSRRGDRGVLFAGTVESAGLMPRLATMQAESERLRQRLAALEASRFFQLFRLWHRLKGR